MSASVLLPDLIQALEIPGEDLATREALETLAEYLSDLRALGSAEAMTARITADLAAIDRSAEWALEQYRRAELAAT